MNRREFLKFSAVAGAVLSSTGAVLSSVGFQKDEYVGGNYKFITAGKSLKSGIIYNHLELKSAIFEFKEKNVINGKAFGEIDVSTSLNVDFSKVSHIITDVYMSGNDGFCTIQLLDTDKGNIIRDLYASGVRYRLSPIMSGVVVDGNVSQLKIHKINITL